MKASTKTNGGNGIRPRHIAEQILLEPDRSKWKAIAETAPPEWLGLIRKHVEIGLRKCQGH